MDTLRASLLSLARRVINFELCQVAESDNRSDYPCQPGYEMAVANAEEFSALADINVANQYRDAFSKGDYSVVTTHNNQLVGYNFYSSTATRVNDQVEFRLNDRYVYSYGAYTHPDHRGLGLSPARWTFARNWRIERGVEQLTVHYISLDNLSSLQSGDRNYTVVGYCAYIGRRKPGARLYCFNSPGCRRRGVGFYPSAAG